MLTNKKTRDDLLRALTWANKPDVKPLLLGFMAGTYALPKDSLAWWTCELGRIVEDLETLELLEGGFGIADLADKGGK